MRVRYGCVIRCRGVRSRVHTCLCSGLDVTFEECQAWAQPSKNQKHVVTGRSSERKHLRFTSKAMSATRPQVAEPLERPAAAADPPEWPEAAAAEPLEQPASVDPRQHRPRAPTRAVLR